MISIVIPVYNQWDMTKQCLESIIRHSGNVDYEIIIIDNGSTPPVREQYFNGYDNIIRNETNLGFPVAVNQGIRAATGDIICLLNNDTVVTPHWLERLTARLDEYDIVSPMTNYVAGLQKAITATYDDESSLNHAAIEWTKQNDGVTQEVNFVIGFCMVFRKALFNDIGDFDESMFPCSGEEIDFCFRCRDLGGKVAIARDVYIHHYGSQTFMEMQQSGVIDYKKVCVECDKNIESRWANKFLKSFWQEQGNIERFQDRCKIGERLNLGCGRYHLEGFINLDKAENVNPDIVCDVLKLHYSNESIEEIYCGHLLEHMTLDEGIEALAYWKSLLKKGGKITITVPDFDVLARKYLENPTPDKLIELNNVYIYSYCQESQHKYCYSGELLKSLMVKAGFVEIQKLPLNHHYFVDPVDWQVAYEGRKA